MSIPSSAFINDGYTREAYIKPVDRLRPAVRFTYRPALVVERDEILYGPASKGTPTAQAMAVAKLVASKIKAWNVCDANGKPVEINDGNVLRLDPSLFDRVFQIVLGSSTSDEDPEATNAEKERAAREEYQRLMSGGATPVEGEGKN